MAQIVVIDSRELLRRAPFSVLLVLKYTDSIANLFHRINHLMPKVISFNVCKKGINLGWITIEFLREEVFSPLLGS